MFLILHRAYLCEKNNLLFIQNSKLTGVCYPATQHLKPSVLKFEVQPSFTLGFSLRPLVGFAL